MAGGCSAPGNQFFTMGVPRCADCSWKPAAPTVTGSGSMAAQTRSGLVLRMPADPGRTATAAALSALVLLAFGLRLVPVLISPSLNWGDEVFQTTEQAHRLVYGTGLIPWEFQLGMRSWLVPGVLAGLMEFARIFGEGPDYYLPVIAAACGVLAVVPVICCFLWCRRSVGLAAALVGGLAVAVAPELVYMGDRTLSEVLSAHLLVLALYLLEPGYRVTSERRLFWAGAILGIAFLLRIQLAPAIALVAFWSVMRAPPCRFLAIAGGGTSVLALAALLDAVTLGYPLASIWRNIDFNVLYGASSTFGIAPWYFYGFAELAIWGDGLAVLLVLALLGTRRMWLPLAAALVIVAVHSVIAHKEYRFIYPALVLLTVQAGVGLADLVGRVQRRLVRLGRWRIPASAAVGATVAGGWCLLSLLVWNGPVIAAFRHRAHDYILAASYVAHDPAVCGIGLYGTDAWVKYGGYSYLHQRVPIYWPKNRSELAFTAPGFDVLLYATQPPMPPGFVKQMCFGKVCLARHPGRCMPAPTMSMPFPAPLAGFAAQLSPNPVIARDESLPAPPNIGDQP